MNNLLPHITLETGKSPQHSIIWLHGLGADGGDFVSVAEEMDLPLAVRYIFPNAPMQPVTLNGGYVMRAWYDIVANDLSAGLNTGIGAQQDAAGIRKSQLEIEKLIAQERQRGSKAENIFIAGFSQGGAIALHTGLRHAEKLGGIIALSTYLPLADTLADATNLAAQGTPIFMTHGYSDPVVPYILGKRSAERLAGLGYQLEWHAYEMPHTLCIEEVRDIEAWLTRHLSRIELITN
ncbi:MAG: alpha/beta hydrolase [Gallionellaceae bacterium]